MMYADISHTVLPNLKQRTKSVRVVSSRHADSNGDGHEEQPMDVCIESFCSFYADDMEHRSGLTERPNNNNVSKYPTVMGMATLMNPLYGGKNFISCFVFVFKDQTLKYFCVSFSNFNAIANKVLKTW